MANQDAVAVAEIALYGTSKTGAGYIARAWMDSAIVTFGDGVPDQGQSFTDAVFRAVSQLQLCGLRDGLVNIFHPGGGRMSVIDLALPIPYYGDLPTQASHPLGRDHVVSLEDLVIDQAARRLVAETNWLIRKEGL